MPSGPPVQPSLVTCPGTVFISAGFNRPLHGLFTDARRCWSVIIFAGFATSVGFRLPAVVDLVGAWLSKLMPAVDSIILLRMLHRIQQRVSIDTSLESVLQ